MDIEEAKEWLRGDRSMANFFRSLDVTPQAREAYLAVADAAMTQQAYWMVKAEQEGLIDP